MNSNIFANPVILEALKLAYRYISLADPDVGSSEASDALCNALCEAMGDRGFQEWLRDASARLGPASEVGLTYFRPGGE